MSKAVIQAMKEVKEKLIITGEKVIVEIDTDEVNLDMLTYYLDDDTLHIEFNGDSDEPKNPAWHKILASDKKLKDIPTLFEYYATPLIKYMAENHHPHCTLIITSTHAEVLEGIKAVHTIKYLVD